MTATAGRLAPSLLLCGFLATTGAPASGEEDVRSAAQLEAEAGSRAWVAGDFLGAAEAFGRAVGLDPSQAAYAALRARSLGELLVPDDPSPENLARLLTVVSIYDGLLAFDPANEEYAQAVPRLFEKVGDEAGREAWLRARAANSALPLPARAEALRAVAEPLLARAGAEKAAGRSDEAGRLSERARTCLDEAIGLFPGSVACHALRLHGLALEIALAREAEDDGRRARLEALQARAQRAADAAVARHPALPSPDDY